MGKEILYCNKCGKKLTGDDFTRGRAHTFDNRQYCSRCLPKQFDTPKPTAPPSSRKRPQSSVQLQVLPPAPAPKSSRSALYVSLAVAGIVVCLLLVFMATPSDPPPAPPPPAAATPVAPKTVDPRKIAEELKSLEGKIQERLQGEQFAAAVDVLEEAKKRHEAPEWIAAVTGRIREVRELPDKLYPDLKSKAAAAQAKGDSLGVAEQRTRLTAWGRKELLARLEKDLSAIVPQEPLPPGAVVLFRFPHEGPGNRPYRPHGNLKEGGLGAPVYSTYGVNAGFENLKPHFPIPTEGEFWLTYSTNSPKPMNLRVRVVRGDKTQAYNWNFKKPEVGRPARVKAPLRQFIDFGNKLINKGDEVASIYIEQSDLKAELLLHEAVIFRTKE